MSAWPSEIIMDKPCPICNEVRIPTVCRNCGEVVCIYCCTHKRPYISVLENTPFHKMYDPKHKFVPVCDQCVNSPHVLYHDIDFSEEEPHVIKLGDMARESIVQANDHFRQSSSKMYRFGDYNMAFHSNEQQITSHRKKVHNIMRKPELLGGKALDKSDPMKEIESMVQNSLKYSVANCSEMASFCYLLLHHYAKLGLIKFKDMGIFKLPHADHVFLIIVPLGEELLPWKFKSTYAKIKSSKALVCDPWVKSFFYLKDYHKIIGNHFISLVKNFAYSSLKKYKLSTSFDLERCLLINNGVEELLDLVKSCKEAMSYFIFNKSDKKDNFEKLIEYIQKKKAISYQDYSYVLRKVISTALENRNSLRNKPGSSSECLKKINFYPQMKNVIGKQLGMNLNGGQLDYKSMVKYSEINNNEITV